MRTVVVLLAVGLAGCRRAPARAPVVEAASEPVSQGNSPAARSTRPAEEPDVFLGCPPEGKGGDPRLNRKKNRGEAATNAEPTTVADVVAWTWPRAVEGRRLESTWTESEAREVAEHEGRAIAVDGFLLDAKEEGEESPNCHDPAHEQRDFHVWLAASPDAAKSDAIVVEVTPRHRARHPGWTVAALRKLARTKRRVRITGFAMLDPEHPEQLGKTRATLWEIHPITNIAVETASGFLVLE